MVIACGLAVALLGFAVLAGWLTGNAALVQVIPSAPPLRADLAIAFALAGAALALTPGSYLRAARVLSLATVALALFACARYALTDTGLPFDQLFYGSPPPALFVSDPSRMSVASAVSMFLAGLGILFVPLRPTAGFALGMMTATLGLIELTGYFFGIGVDLLWGASAGAAIHASVGFLVLGGGVILESTRRNAVAGRRRIEPYLVGLVTAAGSALFWQSLVHQENVQVDRLLNATAVGIRSTLADRLSDLTSSLEIFAAETDRLRDDNEAWRSNVQILMANHPSIVALNWLKQDGTLVAEAWNPKRGHAAELDGPDDSERAALAALAARHSRRAVIGRISALNGDVDQARLRLLAPLRRGRDSEILVALVDIETFALDALTGTHSENGVTIRAGDRLLFRSAGTANRAGLRTVAKRALTLPLNGGLEWTVEVSPSAAQIATRSPIPAIALLAGLIISALLVSALHASELDRGRARALADALRRLEFQARQLRDTDRRLRDLNEELENRVGERTRQLSKANDVLERENRLRRRAQLRLTSANQNLREFDAFISHELRQPLAAMRLWVDLLEATGADQLAEKHRGYVQKISLEIQRMSDLIENELTLSKSSDADTTTEPLHLEAVLDEIAQSLAPRLEEIGAEIVVGNLPLVLADPRQMRQLFLNLIDNAIKYRRDDTALRIRVEATKEHGEDYTETYGDEYCEIVVEDNGRGISSEKTGEIFDLFRRVGDDHAVSGSGVGLAICRRIAERHDGTIFADAAPHHGARFHVILPLAEASAESAAS